jgi:predicted GIY-YIG superfamily endonuclease
MAFFIRGVTSDLKHRVYQHKKGLCEGFTKKYGCTILVWYEAHGTMASAIAREKRIKTGSRKSKLELIEAVNPEWKDLFGDV